VALSVFEQDGPPSILNWQRVPLQDGFDQLTLAAKVVRRCRDIALPGGDGDLSQRNSIDPLLCEQLLRGSHQREPRVEAGQSGLLGLKAPLKQAL
jgi:hypothetical protein